MLIGPVEALVGVGAFLVVLENFAVSGVDADFVGGVATLYVEGVAKAAAASFFFQLLIRDRPGPRLERNGAGLLDVDLGFSGELVASISNSV